MGLTGIDRLVFGVEDLVLARRFLEDWGLTDAGSTDASLLYLTQDRSEVSVRHHLDPSLPPAIEQGSTLREVTWGTTDDGALRTLADRLGRRASMDAQGELRTTDPNGMAHVFRGTRRTPVAADPQDVNGPGVARRIDRRGRIYERARPLSIGHVVLFVDDLSATVDFFQRTLGFAISDSYSGYAAFLRARTPGSHHDAFVLSRPGRPGLNHVAFTVSNIHEVFGGGLAMSRRGWETDLGPGRHPISSAYFWYFKSPFGGSLEYFADDDWCTEAWQPREFERRPELFAEWAIAGGIDGNTRRQARAADVDRSK